jgi:hypothetical protein
MLWQLHCTLLSEHILLSYLCSNIFTRGFEPSPKSQGAATGANVTQVASSSNLDSKTDGPQKEDKERRRKKEERKQEKRARKELKKLNKSGEKGLPDLKDLPHRNHSRSRSPRFRRLSDGKRPRSPSRSRTSVKERCTRYEISSNYDSLERERKMENDRQRWDMDNA